MTFVHIPYRSITQLIQQFRDLSLEQHAVNPLQLNPAPNFVLIEPHRYFGTYGGIVQDHLLSKLQHLCYSESIANSLSIVWWKSFVPHVTGDLHALTLDNSLVAVTPNIFRQMQEKNIPPPVKSAYYASGVKPWRMNSASN